MSLSSRIETFDKVGRRFPCERPSRLVCVHRIEENAFESLRVAAAIYMSRCLPGNRLILEGSRLLEEFERHQDLIQNITPNGLIVPKRYIMLEYNLLVRAFAQVISGLGMEDLIVYWHIPLNLRIQFGQTREKDSKRNYPVEHIHSDSWAGQSTESVTVHIPIFGDVSRNHIELYDPPTHFREDWLGPLQDYAAGDTIVREYSKIDFIPPEGHLILADFAILYAYTRLPGAGPCVSLDTTFVLKKPSSHDEQEKIHPWRESERASHQVLTGLGETHLLLFPHDLHERVEVPVGFKHPTQLELIELVKAPRAPMGFSGVGE